MNINWTKTNGLLPAIVQHHQTLQVLMLGYMNEEALQQTLTTQKVTFFSRSKNRLWVKGETSGHELALVSITPDCDGDALLIMANPIGPTCHRDTVSCFGEEGPQGVGFLAHLEQVIHERAQNPSPNSYTATLLADGMHRLAQKVGEEGVEVALAAVSGNAEMIKNESADLLFHLLVLMHGAKINLSEVLTTLAARSSKPNGIKT